MTQAVQGNHRLADSREGRRITWAGALLNLVLIIGKALAGIFGHSQALIADAVHSFSDLASDAVVLAGLAMGRAAPDERHHYGHGRLETLASLVVGLFLIGAAIAIGWQAADDLYNHTTQTPTWLALFGAAFSLVVKEALYHYTMAVARRMKSKLLAANAWHHRSDALSSLAVFIGVGAALAYPAWRMADALAALAVAALLLKVGFDICRDAVLEMTDAAPSREVMQKINHCILSVDGVKGVNQVQVRSLAGLYEMQVRIAVDSSISVADGHSIALQVEQCLQKDIDDAGEILIHVDPKA